MGCDIRIMHFGRRHDNRKNVAAKVNIRCHDRFGRSPIARSSVDGTWTNGEKVTVQAITKTGDAYNWNDAISYPYEINNDIPVALTKEETHYWQRSDETKLIRTWYCADGSTSNTLPDSWSVAADQDETGNGYAESDLLFTAPVEVKFGSTAN